jgi:LTXXQ motif family protein
MRSSFFFGALAATALGLAVAAMTGMGYAQQSGPQDQSDGWNGGYMMGSGMMGSNGMMGHGGMGSWMMGGNGPSARMCGMMTAHIDGRLAYLKTELKITDAQTSLWNAYAEAARDNAQGMSARCTAMMTTTGAAGLSLPDRLDQHEQFMAAQLESIRTMNKALKPLFAGLSDSQKQTANQFFGGPMGMMW